MELWDDKELEGTSDIDRYVDENQYQKQYKFDKASTFIDTIGAKVSNDNGLFDEINKVIDNETVKAVPMRYAEVSKGTSASSKTHSYIIAIDLIRIYDIRKVAPKRVCYYNEKYGYWEFIIAREVDTQLRNIIPDKYVLDVNKVVLNEIFSWFLCKAPTIREDEFFNNTEYVNFLDCAINAKTRVPISEQQRKELLFPYYVPWEYLTRDKLRNGSFKALCNDVYPDDPKTKKELSKIYGMSISNIRTNKISGLFLGPPNSGKSLMLNLNRDLVGHNFSTSVSFSQMNSEFAVAQLYNKRLNTSAEMSGAGRVRIDVFKTLVGNDPTMAAFKFEDPFEFKNYCFLLFASNEIPHVDNYMELQPFLSRLVIFPFVNVKPRKEWNNNLQKELLGDMGNVIDFALDGVVLLLEGNFEFKETTAMKQAKKNFAGEQNSFALFAKKYIINESNNHLLSSDIKEYYEAYCEKHKYPCLSHQKWSKYLQSYYNCKPYHGSKDAPDGIKRARGYKGIAFNNEIFKLDKFIDTAYDFMEEEYLDEE